MSPESNNRNENVDEQLNDRSGTKSNPAIDIINSPSKNKNNNNSSSKKKKKNVLKSTSVKGGFKVTNGSGLKKPSDMDLEDSL